MKAVTRTSKRLWAAVNVCVASAINVSPRCTVHKFPLHEADTIFDGALPGLSLHAVQKASADATAKTANIINLNILEMILQVLDMRSTDGKSKIVSFYKNFQRGTFGNKLRALQLILERTRTLILSHIGSKGR